MAVSPYPYASWPRLTAGALRGARRWRAALAETDASRARGTLAELLGAPLALSAGHVVDRSRAQALALREPTDVVLVGTLEGDAARTPLWLLLPQALAAELADRALGGDGAAVPQLDAQLDDLSLGALAYLAARAAAGAGGRLRLSGIGADATTGAGGLPGDALLVWPLTLELAARRWTLRVLTPQAPAPGEPRGHSARSSLPPQLRVTLCAHAATLTLTRAQAAQLEVGDALVPARCNLEHGIDGFQGEVWLHAQGARRCRIRCHGAGAELRIEGFEHDGGRGMTEGKRIEGGARVAELVGDAPIELCLELARFSLSLEQLAQLAPGDALSTGRAIGERVLLRAGTVVVAEGELIDVDGEVGVRLTHVPGDQKLDVTTAGVD